MPLNAYEWSVIVAGRWNRAILTPQGIGQRLFGLPIGTPLSVEVPIDSLGPYRVTHEEITVSTTGLHLLIQPEKCNFQNLQRAMTIAATALESLPETPLSAVGINARYKTSESLGVLADVTRHNWDDDLSDSRLEILSKSMSRSIKWKEGRVNFTALEEEGEFAILFNIELKSTVQAEHRLWLSRPIGEVQEIVQLLLEAHLHISRNEAAYD